MGLLASHDGHLMLFVNDHLTYLVSCSRAMIQVTEDWRINSEPEPNVNWILVGTELKPNVACGVSVQLDFLDHLVDGMISLSRKVHDKQDDFGQGIPWSHLVR